MSTNAMGYVPVQSHETEAMASGNDYSNNPPIYYPPPPPYALTTPEYTPPPIPAPYGNASYTPSYQPHDSYFPQKPPYQQYQQPQQPLWPASPVGQQQVVGQPTWLTSTSGGIANVPAQYPPQAQYPQSALSSQFYQPPQAPLTPQYTPTSPFPPQTQLPPASYLLPTPATTSAEPTTTQQLEDAKSNWGKRFVGNTLAGRVVRASVQSVTSTLTLPMYLSPWGDNNPVTLPNLRKRDAVLVGASHLGVVGLESVAPSVLEFTGTVVDGTIKFGTLQLAEQGVDEGISQVTPRKPIKVVRTANVKSMQARIKHKLMGVDANIRFVGEYPARHQAAYDKGWFCPYLYASGRAPSIPRARDFAIAELSDPGLRGKFIIRCRVSQAPTNPRLRSRRRPGSEAAVCDC